MEVLSESTAFSSRDGSDNIPASVLLVNFRRLKVQEEEQHVNGGSSKSQEDFNYSDLFHSMAAMYSAALPDMELEAIYGCLNKPSRSIIVLATEEAVLSYRERHGPTKELKIEKNKKTTEEEEEEEEEEYVGPYCDLFSDEETENDNNGDCIGGEEEEDDFEKGREQFLANVKERRLNNKIGIEDKLVGSITFMKLSSKPGETSFQILLLAVRHRWRGYGVGEYLLRLCKDPAVIGKYDVILTYADHKAETFFHRYGFSDDPIVTTRYKLESDYWENSTLMACIPPYSANTSGSLKSIEAMDEQIKKWRMVSIVSHCEQVSIIERLRQEVLLLQGRLLSQGEVIDTLHRELKQSQVQRQSVETEFKAYRKKMQEKLMSLLEERANEWIEKSVQSKEQTKLNIENDSQ